jgi:hypothetical protein
VAWWRFSSAERCSSSAQRPLPPRRTDAARDVARGLAEVVSHLGYIKGDRLLILMVQGRMHTWGHFRRDDAAGGGGFSYLCYDTQTRASRRGPMAELCCPCGQGSDLWGEFWWTGGEHRWVFFDHDKRSLTYAERIERCPGCGRRLERKDLIATHPAR